MAILDKGLEFSDAQAVTASAASTNVLDLGVVAPNTGRGSNQMYLQIVVNTTADASGSATVAFALEDSADDSSFAVVPGVSVAAIGKATLVAGYIVLTIALPPRLRRYIRVYYTVATGPLTAGKFDAFLTTVPNK